MMLDGTKDIQSVKSVWSIRIPSLKPASYPLSRGGRGNEGHKTNTHRDTNIHFETLLLLLKHIKGQILIKDKQLLKSGQKLSLMQKQL